MMAYGRVSLCSSVFQPPWSPGTFPLSRALPQVGEKLSLPVSAKMAQVTLTPSKGPNRRPEGVNGSRKFDLKNRKAYVPIKPDALQKGEYQHRVAQNGYRR